MTHAPDPLAGDVPTEPTPRTGWRRLTPLLPVLLAVVVVVGWQVLGHHPSVETQDAEWSSSPFVTCGKEQVSPHGTGAAAVKDGSPLYAVEVRNTSQFPVTLSSTDVPAVRVGFTDVVSDPDAPFSPTDDTRSSVSVPTGQSVWLVLRILTPIPEMEDPVSIWGTTLGTTTLGIASSRDVTFPSTVVLRSGTKLPAAPGCS
ncbi:MAG TPA: hypothetical protein VNR17_05550 [Luteimicrobium sp.]|nr:hypothetical protein [Luteimicrobium sp.]